MQHEVYGTDHLYPKLCKSETCVHRCLLSQGMGEGCLADGQFEIPCLLEEIIEEKSNQFSSSTVVGGLILRLKTSTATSVVYILRISSVRGFFFFFPQVFPRENEIKDRVFYWGKGLVFLTL